jgi:hypothetical protein
MPAQLEPPGPRKRLAENQAGAVVESFKGLRIELVDGVSLASRLRRRGIRRSPTHRATKHAVQPAARDELRVLESIAHRSLLS